MATVFPCCEWIRIPYRSNLVFLVTQPSHHLERSPEAMHTSPKLSALIAVALILAMALSLIPIGLAPVLAVSPNIVISQVYGGGGNTGATYTHDFIELFNRGTISVSLAGWSVQYTSATGIGNFGSATKPIPPPPPLTLSPG